MQVKKEILLFCSLVVLCCCLLFVSSFRKNPSLGDAEKKQVTPVKCCQSNPKTAADAPLNYIALGILHLSA